MKQIVFIIFLSLVFVLSIKAQDSTEVSQLTPCPVPRQLTKSELKKIKDQIIHIFPSEPLKIFVGIEPIILPNEKRASLIKSQMNSYEVVFQDMNNGDFQGRFNFFIRISSIDKRTDGCFEEKRNFTLKKDEIGRKVWLNYNKLFELPKDKYTITFIVRDIQTGMIGVEKITFEVN